MVLAAGFGTRLRPITDTDAEADGAVAGKPMIDTVIDRLGAIGVQEWSSTRIISPRSSSPICKARAAPRIAFSREEEILETGGGITKALPLLGADPFYVINGKIIWLNGKTDALVRLAEVWDDGRHGRAAAAAADGDGGRL